MEEGRIYEEEKGEEWWNCDGGSPIYRKNPDTILPFIYDSTLILLFYLPILLHLPFNYSTFHIYQYCYIYHLIILPFITILSTNAIISTI